VAREGAHGGNRVSPVKRAGQRPSRRERALGLRGRLSNPEFKDLLQSLTNLKVSKVPAKRRKEPNGRSDGRREFGSVSGAIVQVLAQGGTEMRLRDIHAEVEKLLAGAVSLGSVADYLGVRSRGSKPLFERTRYSYYRLRDRRPDCDGGDANASFVR
jgi:hypothetical protein